MNLRSLCSLTFAALLAGAGCSTPECVSAADCADGMVCQAEKCVAPQPITCSPACSGSTPVCDEASRTCIACTKDEGCAAGLVCDTSFAGGRCVGCLVEGDCSGTKPICDPATSSCVGCLVEGDCSGTTPICDPATSSCVACTSDTHCSGTTPHCDPNARACVGCVDASDCSEAAPYCDPASKSCVACADPAGCVATALKVVRARGLSTSEVEVEFERLVDPVSVLADGSQFSFSGGLSAGSATVSGKLVRVATSAQTPGSSYTVTVATSVYDLDGAAVGATDNSAEFTAPRPQARLVINEINPNIPNSRDLIEFLVVEAGTTKQMTVVEEGKTNDPLTFSTFPDAPVQAGDIVVLHLNPVDAADPKSSERQSKSESTAANAYPNAWDFVGGSAAVTFSHRLIKLVAADGTVQDVVAFAKSDMTTTPPGGYVAAVRIAQGEGQWLPADCGGAECTYESSPSVLDVSVDWKDLGLEGGNQTTASMSRIPGPDTNSAADWVLQLSGATFGSPNPTP